MSELATSKTTAKLPNVDSSNIYRTGDGKIKKLGSGRFILNGGRVTHYEISKQTVENTTVQSEVAATSSILPGFFIYISIVTILTLMLTMCMSASH